MVIRKHESFKEFPLRMSAELHAQTFVKDITGQGET